MRISASFPTLSDLSSGKSKKKGFLQKNETFRHIETFQHIEDFLLKFFNETPKNFAKEVEQNFMKVFL